MKAQLYFIKCISFIYLSFFLWFFNCSSDIDVQTVEVEPLTNVLTLEWTFGGEYDTHKEEYLLAEPRGIAANDKGDIFIGDELSIKVFDKNGNEKRIIGRRGQGPGEFTSFMGIAWPKLYISPEGFFTVLEQSDTYHVFSPEYLFLIKRNLRNNLKLKSLFEDFNLFPDPRVNDLISVNENEIIFTISTDDENKRRGLDAQRYDLFVYENSDTMFAIKKLLSTSFIPLPRGGMGSNDFRWYLLPDRRLIYTHNGYDKQMNKSESRYILHILSLDTFQETHISHTYIPIAFSDSLINSFNWDRTPEEKRDAKIIREHYKKVKYFDPIQKIIADDNYVFVFTYQKNDKGEFLCDIIDTTTERYLRSVYFPQWVARFSYLDQITIKVGYVYRMKAPRDEFAEVHKYKIDPAVYGK
ncbi:hypothetical protein AMJ80_08860 [bacterium SM23_31]|nr:MAG: hypothetical protein AMJ80_08860 [bacterium SM23_31]